jgi:hypothetical protein
LVKGCELADGVGAAPTLGVNRAYGEDWSLVTSAATIGESSHSDGLQIGSKRAMVRAFYGRKNLMANLIVWFDIPVEDLDRSISG